MKKDKLYYRDLDILRIVLCIAVFLYHLGILKGGFLAVCSFFVLTGYLAVISSFNKEKFSLWQYYKSRFKQIYLPLLIVVFITIAIVSFLADNSWVNIKPETYSVLLGYNNFWQLSANLDYFARHVSSPFMHFWYIGILLQFELIFPLIFGFFRLIGEKIHKIVPCILLSFVAIGLAYLFYYLSCNKDIMFVYYNTFSRIFSIFFGVALGFITHYYGHLIPKFMTNKIIRNVIFILYLIGLIVLTIFIDSQFKYFAIIMILVTIMTTRLIDYCTINTRNELSIFDRIIKYFANISYEIYLVQYPVIFLFQYVVLSNYLKVFIIIGIVIAISCLLHYAFNKVNKLLGLKYILEVLFIIGAFYGIYTFVITKDYTVEIHELQLQLLENEKMMELKQEEYASKLKEQEDLWASKLASLEDDEAKIADIVTNLPIICVGDSVMLGAVPNLTKKFPNGYFDAKISRTDYVVEGILTELKDKKMLGGPIILNFGANGDCRNNKCKVNLMKVAGDRDVYWLTVTNDKDVHFNSRIKEFAKDYPNLHIIDWESISKNHSEYFYKDGIHLTESGRKAYVNAIYNAIYNSYLEEYNKKKEELLKVHEEELKTMISFFGNSLLIGAFNDLQSNFSSAKFNYNMDYNFESLKAEIQKEIEDNTLNYNIVLMFDSTLLLSKEEYQELISLVSDHKIYVVKTTDQLDVPEDVSVIDFYSELINNTDYLVRDSVYLTSNGNEALKKLLTKEFVNIISED